MGRQTTLPYFAAKSSDNATTRMFVDSAALLPKAGLPLANGL